MGSGANGGCEGTILLEVIIKFNPITPTVFSGGTYE